MSNGAIGTCEVDDGGKVLVGSADGMPRALPVQSIVRVSDRKDEPRFRPSRVRIWQGPKFGRLPCPNGLADPDFSQRSKRMKKVLAELDQATHHLN